MKAGFLLRTNDDPKQGRLGPLQDQRSNRPSWGSSTSQGNGWGNAGNSSTTAGWGHMGNSTTAGWGAAKTGSHSTADTIQPPPSLNPLPAQAPIPEEPESNPYAHVLNRPYKTGPKGALQALYGNRIKDLCMSEYYHTWNDGNPKNHLLQQTCIFVCPLTGELFQTGQLAGDTKRPPVVDVSPLDNATTAREAPLRAPTETTCLPWRWMSKKKAAEDGAAAWAYDCFQFRLEQGEQLEKRLGMEEPYRECRMELPKAMDIAIDTTSAPTVHVPPTHIPPEVCDEIVRQQEEIRKRNQQWAQRVEMEEEQAWHERKAPFETLECASNNTRGSTKDKEGDIAQD